MNNWKDSQQGDMQVVEIHLTRGVVIALGLMLLVVMVLGYLVWSEREVAAAGAQSISTQASVPPKYYLTIVSKPGNQALTACATGYHMASLWEILDTTNLEYDTTLGVTLGDSGSGPPTNFYGWVRTGYIAGSSTTPGRGNCDGWTSASASDYGTFVLLPRDWTVAAGLTAPWEVNYTSCDMSGIRVWCVED